MRCSELRALSNESIIMTGDIPGSTANITCLDGYRLYGNSSRICLPNGKWSGNDTLCEGIVYCQVDSRITFVYIIV